MTKEGSDETKKKGKGLRQLFKYREHIICSNIFFSVISQRERRVT